MTNSSANNTTGAAELFHMLESNKLRDVEETKKVFYEHFLQTKDNWLVNGLFDYYLSTDSLRAVEVLAGVREPHDKHLFDKLSDTLAAKSANNGQKVRSLTLLGHVARRQPTWLHKLASHTLFKQLLALIKVEEDIVLLMSALFLLITLLPMLPTAVSPYLSDIFDVFSRLATFYYNRFLSVSSSNSTTVSTTSLNLIGGSSSADIYLLHLQVGLYNLFHRLYAMYPCNFVHFLKQQYIQRDQVPIFKKIISPMLDSVRMHPLLVTMSKDSEIHNSRWKKMEHHDVIAECGRFSLFERACRDEAVPLSSMRFTPISEYSCPYTPISTNSISVESTGLLNGNQENFWSPSMVVSAHSPPPPNSLQATPISQYDSKSTPSTPGGGLGNVISSGSGGGAIVRSRTSPPEAAVEATPETTPVKDLRQLPSRQLPVGSAAVRALSGLGNGLINSRPSTPSSNSQQQTQHHAHHLTSPVPMLGSAEGSSALNRRLGTIFAERQNTASRQEQPLPMPVQEDPKRSLTATPVMREQIHAMLNGKMDAWHQHSQLEDQEVSDIVSSTKFIPFTDKDTGRRSHDLSRKVQLRFVCGHPTPPIPPTQGKRRAKSCSDIIAQGMTSLEASTQTCDVLPYESFLLDIVDQQNHQPQADSTSTTPAICGAYSDSRLSPSAMLERYIEVCARSTNHFDGKQRQNMLKPISSGIRRNDESENNQHFIEENEQSVELDRFNQQLQLMQMQLQFERHRREVHAERNRRLLGKLRESRGLEELNCAMTNRLKLAENELEVLKNELNTSKQEARAIENKLAETVQHYQSECKEEQHRNITLRGQIELLEEELKNEKNKALELEKQARAAEATLFEAAHQLREALRAANQSEELKRTLDSVQKRFLLLGEAQTRIQEKMGGPVHIARQEMAQIQRSYSEELANLRNQLNSQTLQMENLKSRFSELERKDAGKEDQLVEQQRLLQESKEKHSAELEAVESKYKAQLEINLLLETKILELHGRIDQIMITSSASGSNLASSISPKERSPPLSASLASSNEGSTAIIHSAMNDCSGEISNLQAIVDPVPVVSTNSTGPKTPQR